MENNKVIFQLCESAKQSINSEQKVFAIFSKRKICTVLHYGVFFSSLISCNLNIFTPIKVVIFLTEKVFVIFHKLEITSIIVQFYTREIFVLFFTHFTQFDYIYSNKNSDFPYVVNKLCKAGSFLPDATNVHVFGILVVIPLQVGLSRLYPSKLMIAIWSKTPH